MTAAGSEYQRTPCALCRPGMGPVSYWNPVRKRGRLGEGIAGLLKRHGSSLRQNTGKFYGATYFRSHNSDKHKSLAVISLTHWDTSRKLSALMMLRSRTSTARY